MEQIIRLANKLEDKISSKIFTIDSFLEYFENNIEEVETSNLFSEYEVFGASMISVKIKNTDWYIIFKILSRDNENFSIIDSFVSKDYKGVYWSDLSQEEKEYILRDFNIWDDGFEDGKCLVDFEIFSINGTENKDSLAVDDNDVLYCSCDDYNFLFF